LRQCSLPPSPSLTKSYTLHPPLFFRLEDECLPLRFFLRLPLLPFSLLLRILNFSEFGSFPSFPYLSRRGPSLHRVPSFDYSLLFREIPSCRHSPPSAPRSRERRHVISSCHPSCPLLFTFFLCSFISVSTRLRIS